MTAPTKKLVNSLDPEEVARFWFYRDSDDTGLSPLQVSWDEETWTDLPAGTDKLGDPGFYLDVVGPGVTGGAGKVLSPLTRNPGAVRHRDNPEIEVHRFHIDVKRSTH